VLDFRLFDGKRMWVSNEMPTVAARHTKSIDMGMIYLEAKTDLSAVVFSQFLSAREALHARHWSALSRLNGAAARRLHPAGAHENGLSSFDQPAVIAGNSDLQSGFSGKGD
jgi:hypothetical protein